VCVRERERERDTLRPGRLGWVVSAVMTVSHVERLGQRKREVQRESEREKACVCE